MLPQQQLLVVVLYCSSSKKLEKNVSRVMRSTDSSILSTQSCKLRDWCALLFHYISFLAIVYWPVTAINTRSTISNGF